MKSVSQFNFAMILAALFVACSGGNGGAGPGAPLPSNNARLADLSVSASEFDQIFQPDQLNYTASVSLLRSTTTVSASTEHSAATIRVDGVPLASGAPSSKVTLDQGSNMIVVLVTAEDGVTTATYTIDVTRQAVESFAQRFYLKASNTNADAWFGSSAAMSEYVLAVGAPHEDSAATGINGDQIDMSAWDSGAVYVFTRDAAEVWAQRSYVKASNTDIGDQFGFEVALFEDTLAVSAIGEDSAATGINGDQSDNSLESTGAVYVFVRDFLGAWSQQSYIKASNTDPAGGGSMWGTDMYGGSLALSGDTLVVGAHGESSAATGIDGDQADNSMPGSGAVYVYIRDSNGVWSQQAYIKASNTGSIFWDDLQDEYSKGDRFGWSVAISGDTLVVGAPLEDGGATGVNGDDTDDSGYQSGAAYIFDRDDAGTWTQKAYLKASDTSRQAIFGYSVAISENTVAVSGGGAVYVFERDAAGTWSQQAYIKASNDEFGDKFGRRVTIVGDSLVVYAHGEDSAATGINGDQSDNTAEDAGAVYLFTRDGAGNWAQQAYIKASNTDADDRFGSAISFSDDTLVVGAPWEDSAASVINGDQSDNSAESAGSVYVFQ